MQWSHPDDYHLTLRFIGGAARDQIEALREPLPFAPIDLQLRGLQTFPPQKDRGVIWIALQTLPPALDDLQKRLEARAQALGYPAERRPYTPHLTLGRFPSTEMAAVAALQAAFVDEDWGSFTAQTYALMKRRSGAKNDSPGPLYEVLAQFTV